MTNVSSFCLFTYPLGVYCIILVLRPTVNTENLLMPLIFPLILKMRNSILFVNIIQKENEKMHNPNSLDTICAALTYALGIPAPQEAAPKNSDLAGYVDKILIAKKPTV